MIEYEVNITVSADIVDAYLAWLPGHIEEMLLFPGFVGSECKRELINGGSVTDTDVFNIVVRYQVDTIENLNHYFENQAQNMRAKTLRMFPGKLQYSRRVLQTIKNFAA